MEVPPESARWATSVMRSCAETGGEITMIPYKGAAPGLTALLGGHVEVAIPSYALVLAPI